MAINNVVKKFEKARGKLGIDPAEEILGACVVNPKGTVLAAAVGGVVGMAVAQRARRDEVTGNEQALASYYPKGRAVLAVTSHRVLVAKMGAMSGGPTELTCIYEHGHLQGMSVEQGRTAWPVELRFIDGSSVRLEAARGTGAEGVAAAAQRVWGL